MKQTLSEIRFALKNGFTEIKRGIEPDGSHFFLGRFGYVATDDMEVVKQIEEIIAEYIPVVAVKEVEVVTEKEIAEVKVRPEIVTPQVEETKEVTTVPDGERYVVLEVFNEYEGLKVGQVVSTGKRTRTITEIKKVLTDQGIKEMWIYTQSPSGITTIVGLDTAKKIQGD